MQPTIDALIRFKAVLYGEGSPFVLHWYEYPDEPRLGLLNDMWGLGNPYEPAVLKSMIEQSSRFRLDKQSSAPRSREEPGTVHEEPIKSGNE